MTRNEEYLKTIMDAMGGDSTKIPPYTINSEDDLKYIAAALEERAANKGKFIVTLTPTALDYSGTMDKTVAEINAAYEAGMEIVFRVIIGANEYMDGACTAQYFDGSTYPSFNAYIITDAGLLMYAYTGTVNADTYDSYSTHIYALTPAS